MAWVAACTHHCNCHAFLFHLRQNISVQSGSDTSAINIRMNGIQTNLSDFAFGVYRVTTKPHHPISDRCNVNVMTGAWTAHFIKVCALFNFGVGIGKLGNVFAHN